MEVMIRDVSMMVHLQLCEGTLSWKNIGRLNGGRFGVALTMRLRKTLDQK